MDIMIIIAVTVAGDVHRKWITTFNDDNKSWINENTEEITKFDDLKSNLTWSFYERMKKVNNCRAFIYLTKVNFSQKIRMQTCYSVVSRSKQKPH